MIFIDNVFQNNIGIRGGAISIDRPNFQASKRLERIDQSPSLLIEGNTFKNNQAYIMGNAVYVRYTRQYVKDNYDEVCGGSLYVHDNTFLNNTAVVHSSNGGAISLECDFAYPVGKQPASNMTGKSFDKSIWVSDSVNNRIIKIREFTSTISGNRFHGNEVGQKGTAIYARQISFLLIQENEFWRNMPSYAFRKDIYRPYEMAFLKQLGYEATDMFFVTTLFPSIGKVSNSAIQHNELTYLDE